MILHTRDAFMPFRAPTGGGNFPAARGALLAWSFCVICENLVRQEVSPCLVICKVITM